MAPKKSKTTKPSLKKAGTMAATAVDGQEYLKQAWGEDYLNKVNAMLDARDKHGGDTSSSASSSADGASGTATSTAKSSTKTKTKAKPKLAKARTMHNTAKEAKQLLGTQVLGDTRAETKRRQAAEKATTALKEVSKPAAARKPALKRLGTMAKTAKEGKAYVKRTATAKKTTGRSRRGGRGKKAAGK
jgi:hypothetical protein